MSWQIATVGGISVILMLLTSLKKSIFEMVLDSDNSIVNGQLKAVGIGFSNITIVFLLNVLYLTIIAVVTEADIFTATDLSNIVNMMNYGNYVVLFISFFVLLKLVLEFIYNFTQLAPSLLEGVRFG